MKNALNVFIFFVILFTACIFVYVLPADPNASSYENRAMAERPDFTSDFISGQLSDTLEKYLSDTTAYRVSLLRFSAALEKMYGLPQGGASAVQLEADGMGLGLVPLEENEIITTITASPVPSRTPVPTVPPVIDETPEPASELTPTPSPTPSPTPTPVPTPFSVDVNYHENAVLYERYRENSVTAARYAQIINAYLPDLADNVRVFSMIAPIRVEFMGERYTSANDSQLATITKINEMLDERVIKINAYDILAAHKDEYIYFRTDHHWTALGAYYAYLSFAEAAGFEPIPLSEYTEQSIPGFLGSFGRSSQDQTVRSHPDTLYYYTLNNGTTFSRNLFFIPQDLANLSYRIFLGGDYARLDFTSSNTNGKTLAVVKDSYANALVVWLAPHYERIIVVDPRQYDGSVSQMIKDLGEVDLLFMNYAAATAMGDFIETIYNVR